MTLAETSFSRPDAAETSKIQPLLLQRKVLSPAVRVDPLLLVKLVLARLMTHQPDRLRGAFGRLLSRSIVACLPYQHVVTFG